jgi:plasmid stabilization system protein ParE
VKLDVTGPARERIQFVGAWWRENRPAAPMLFAVELRAAFAQIRSAPEIGQVYRWRGRTFRRVFLPKSRQHVYYSVDIDAAVIHIDAVWGAQRGHGPEL